MATPLIIGHRGASAVAPENTMGAFRVAIAAGADGIEFDVRLTRDGIPVIIHDSTLRRTAGLAARVADLDWAELQRVDVGSWFTRSGNSFPNETIPSLEELLTLFESNDLLIVLEMKCESRSEHLPLAEACCRLLNEHSLKQRVIVECFDLSALTIVKDIDPEIKTAALFEPAFSMSDQRILDKATEVGASVLAPHHRLARPSLVDKAKLAGLQVAIWTVDDPSWIARARSMGIDALITNDPAAMLAHR
ncbi:MAG TPA: glycerophosphodiester phosphodiesterase family protein [Pyrinomonadaceae bacterium]|nr:glycerophosphodiester phosphodiesterase family protein [Pyrinomonadaceae bacterium]